MEQHRTDIKRMEKSVNNYSKIVKKKELEIQKFETEKYMLK